MSGRAIKTHHVIKHTLANPVFNGMAVREIKADIIASRMEADVWYQVNASQLLLSKRLGRVQDPVAKNVMARLNQIATQRAEARL